MLTTIPTPQIVAWQSIGCALGQQGVEIRHDTDVDDHLTVVDVTTCGLFVLGS